MAIHPPEQYEKNSNPSGYHLPDEPNCPPQQKTVNIVAPDNSDIFALTKLSTKFEEANPNIKLNWLLLEERIMRQKIVTDVSTGGGQFDVIFIGLNQAPLFAKRGWLTAMENLPVEYDFEDVFKSLRDGLSYDGKLYALPFNGKKTPDGSQWLWSWAFAIPKSSKAPEEAKKFALWATSKEYSKLVFERTGGSFARNGNADVYLRQSGVSKGAPVRRSP